MPAILFPSTGRSEILCGPPVAITTGPRIALIGNYVGHDEPSPEFGSATPWYSLDRRFVLEPGEARRPVAPIRSKASR